MAKRKNEDVNSVLVIVGKGLDLAEAFLILRVQQ